MMDKYKETFDTWNNLATLYQDKFMDLNLYNDSYDSFCHSVNKRKAKYWKLVADREIYTHYLLSKRPDFDIFGIRICSKND